MSRRSQRSRAAPWRRAVAVSAAAFLLVAARPWATTYFVNPATGDDTNVGTSPATALRTLTMGLGRSNDGGTHTVIALAGEYSAASGETFPLRIPAAVSLHGSGTDRTIVRDARDGQDATFRWLATGGATISASQTLKDLTIDRHGPDGSITGPALQVWATDASASPVLSNVVFTGAAMGIDLQAISYNATAANRTAIDRCVVTDCFWGILAFAYTGQGLAAAMDPVITNTVVSANYSDGISLITASETYGLQISDRRRATSSAVLTNNTISSNLGSGITLDAYNLGYGAGPVSPAIESCVITDNGDFGILESSSQDEAPASLTNNLMGGNALAYWLENNVIYHLDIGSVNARAGNNTNLDGVPLFVRDVRPNWHLRADSPGVERGGGTLAADLDGEPRPSDTDRDGTPRRDIGADEVSGCAVDAILDPATPAPRCGAVTPLQFDASASAVTAGFSCLSPLEFRWYVDGEEQVGETFPTFTILPRVTSTVTMTVACPDVLNCLDAVTTTVVVNTLPTASAQGPYDACVDWDAANVTVNLLGASSAASPATIQGHRWTSSDGVLFGAASINPQLVVNNSGGSQSIAVTYTARDSNTCEASDTTAVRIWRGPRADAGGPYLACQTPRSSSTRIPVTSTAETPAGSTAVAWEWTTSVGRFDDPTLQSPQLILNNLPLTYTATITVTVTDDHGCANGDTTQVTLRPSPTSRPGGPYQKPEDPGPTTRFALNGGTTSGGAMPLTYLWTTDLGTFVAGTETTTMAQLDVVNTGADQTASVCLEATDANGCADRACTVASIVTGSLRPPDDVGWTLRVDDAGTAARLSWTNAPIDAMHGLAATYEVWQSLGPRPAAGTWPAVRPGLGSVPQDSSGTTSVDDAALITTASEDLAFLRVVSVNAAGRSCADPVSQLPLGCP